YQYWINTEDPDVGRFLALFTFLPMDEVRRLGALEGADLRAAKEALAFEVTKLAHGEAAARQAQTTSRALFGPRTPGQRLGDDDILPVTEMSAARLQERPYFADLLIEVGLAGSRGHARRLIQQGG